MSLAICIIATAIIYYVYVNHKKQIYFRLIYPIKLRVIRHKRRNRQYEQGTQYVMKKINESYNNEYSPGFLQYVQYEEDNVYFKEQLEKLKENILGYIGITNSRIKEKDIYRLNKIRQLLFTCGRIYKHKFKDSNGNAMNFPFIRINAGNKIYPTLYHYHSGQSLNVGNGPESIENDWDAKDTHDNKNCKLFIGYKKKLMRAPNSDPTSPSYLDVDTGDLANYGSKGLLRVDNAVAEREWNNYIARYERSMNYNEWLAYVRAELYKDRYAMDVRNSKGQ